MNCNRWMGSGSRAMLAAAVVLATPFLGSAENEDAAATPPETAAPEWKGPDTAIDVEFQQSSVNDVASFLREAFKDEVDILVPEPLRDTPVSLQLKKIKAGELFNAMNHVFAGGRMPLGWNLTMNGNRPTAALMFMGPPPEGNPGESSPPERQRTVQFVGDLIGEEGGPGYTMEALADTLREIYGQAFDNDNNPDFNLSFHNDAQLLILRGRPVDIDFIKETVEELKKKVEKDRDNNPPPEESAPDSNPPPEPAPETPELQPDMK